jgi:hypothetical protein
MGAALRPPEIFLASGMELLAVCTKVKLILKKKKI